MRKEEFLRPPGGDQQVSPLTCAGVHELQRKKADFTMYTDYIIYHIHYVLLYPRISNLIYFILYILKDMCTCLHRLYNIEIHKMIHIIYIVAFYNIL